MDTAQRRKLARFAQTGLPQLESTAKTLCTPMWWQDPAQPVGSAILGNGTICFLNTGERIIGVTADHVYEKYLEHKSGNPATALQLGGTSFFPEERLIDRARSLDLATFDVSLVTISSAGSVVHVPTVWPTDPPEEGDLVLLGGYPGAVREEKPGMVDFPFAWFITRVDSVSPDQMGVWLNRGEAVGAPGHGMPDDLGGISGGPIYRYRETPIVIIELVGFISEYGESFDLVCAQGSRRVNPDGTLNRA